MKLLFIFFSGHDEAGWKWESAFTRFSDLSPCEWQFNGILILFIPFPPLLPPHQFLAYSLTIYFKWCMVYQDNCCQLMYLAELDTFHYLQVISYIRGPLLFIFNFHPTDSYESYRVGVEEAGEYQVSIHSSWNMKLLMYFMFSFMHRLSIWRQTFNIWFLGPLKGNWLLSLAHFDGTAYSEHGRIKVCRSGDP